jgi:hypothetical protein
MESFDWGSPGWITRWEDALHDTHRCTDVRPFNSLDHAIFMKYIHEDPALEP